MIFCFTPTPFLDVFQRNSCNMVITSLKIGTDVHFMHRKYIILTNKYTSLFYLSILNRKIFACSLINLKHWIFYVIQCWPACIKNFWYTRIFGAHFKGQVNGKLSFFLVIWRTYTRKKWWCKSRYNCLKAFLLMPRNEEALLMMAIRQICPTYSSSSKMDHVYYGVVYQNVHLWSISSTISKIQNDSQLMTTDTKLFIFFTARGLNE